MKSLVAIVSVVTRSGDIFWHTRTGLSEEKTKATQFKTANHALRLTRKKYSLMLGRELVSWKVEEI